MHELSITEAILDVVLRHAGPARVTAVHLTVGELSSFVDDSIQLFWTELARGTAAEGAKLHFEKLPATLRCLDCGNEFPLASPDFRCPACGSTRAVPHGGRDCFVHSIEIESPEEAPRAPARG
jgi:hydrogenase nickel incorporation protein HypA/HybF